MTHGVVSILPEADFMAVLEIWDRLEARFGLNGIRVTPYPHFSWQIGEEYGVEAVRSALQVAAAETAPFEVRATGIGIFPGPRPVIYIPVTASQQLLELHRRVWDALAPLGSEISPYYAPGAWTPHISLAYGDVNDHNFGEVVRFLTAEPLHWKFAVNNFSYIYEPAGETGRLLFGLPFFGE